MNCSQKLISLIFGTTRIWYWNYWRWLWIALKSWYLWYSEQPSGSPFLSIARCELLSKVDIFDIRNNTQIQADADAALWIALKSWYLWYSEQLYGRNVCWFSCCELLSKVDIFDIRNNIVPVIIDEIIVVNCSQKLISLIFGTTWMIILIWSM